ncbi:hypothetical protein BDU57DRAFT_322489 [Ampelomyces quisqualis]|uniref:Uncharacterized protein n=1 Tax=Ampelomyces quisqualis TaxID=50730 RepID=A0A6A5QG19_AMPQU|nr:hypothetical protein BDU57DRAFT_322489 [Ampelomyces quisqualis]
MAPFRNRDRSNRSGRGQIEHNVLEGLPINQYREVEITVGASSGENKPVDKNAWPELPMPRDSHMLPEHSQQLLRAARSGRIYKPPAPPEDHDEMKDEEEEHKEVQTGFTIKKYVRVARHLEATEPEYLAKRRKGLPSQYGSAVQPALRETKVKKLDAEGNATVYKVLVPEGQAVEGEVEPTDADIEAAPAAAAPGTIVEGVGVVNAEGVVVASDIVQQTTPRQKLPPLRRKRGGPGRGRRRVNFADRASRERRTPVANAAGEILAGHGVKQEGGSVEPSDGDTPMADAAGDDDEGSGEEGSEDDEHDGDHVSHPATPATPSRPSAPPTSAPDINPVEISNLDNAASFQAAVAATTLEGNSQQNIKREATVPPSSAPELGRGSVVRDASSSPDLPLSTVSHSRQNSFQQNPTSTTTEPEPMTLETLQSAALPKSAGVPVAVAISNPVAETEPAPVEPAQPETEAVQPSPAEIPSAPPSEPDLMASLDRHLEKDSKDIAGS